MQVAKCIAWAVLLGIFLSCTTLACLAPFARLPLHDAGYTSQLQQRRAMSIAAAPGRACVSQTCRKLYTTKTTRTAGGPSSNWIQFKKLGKAVTM